MVFSSVYPSRRVPMSRLRPGACCQPPDILGYYGLFLNGASAILFDHGVWCLRSCRQGQGYTRLFHVHCPAMAASCILIGICYFCGFRRQSGDQMGHSKFLGFYLIWRDGAVPAISRPSGPCPLIGRIRARLQPCSGLLLLFPRFEVDGLMSSWLFRSHSAAWVCLGLWFRMRCSRRHHCARPRGVAIGHMRRRLFVGLLWCCRSGRAKADPVLHDPWHPDHPERITARFILGPTDGAAKR